MLCYILLLIKSFVFLDVLCIIHILFIWIQNTYYHWLHTNDEEKYILWIIFCKQIFESFIISIDKTETWSSSLNLKQLKERKWKRFPKKFILKFVIKRLAWFIFFVYVTSVCVYYDTHTHTLFLSLLYSDFVDTFL